MALSELAQKTVYPKGLGHNMRKILVWLLVNECDANWSSRKLLRGDAFSE